MAGDETYAPRQTPTDLRADPGFVEADIGSSHAGGVASGMATGVANGVKRNFLDDLRKRDFSIYAQWIGLLSGIVCFSTGWQNVFSRALVFSLLAILFGFIIAVLEVHWLVRLAAKCCPNKVFDDMRERAATWFKRNELRAALYLVMSAVQWASISSGITSLIANGILLLAAGLCYAWPAIRKQPFEPSTALGFHPTGQSM